MNTGLLELDAVQATIDVLEAAWAADDDVAVHFGPPPQDTTTPHNVWTGAVETDEELGAQMGQDGPAVKAGVRVTVVLDAKVDDPSPAGALAASTAAWGLVDDLRSEVAGMRAQTPLTTDPNTVYLRATQIVSASSSGPLPLEDSDGWVDTVVCQLAFVGRIIYGGMP